MGRKWGSYRKAKQMGARAPGGRKGSGSEGCHPNQWKLPLIKRDAAKRCQLGARAPAKRKGVGCWHKVARTGKEKHQEHQKMKHIIGGKALRQRLGICGLNLSAKLKH